MVFFACPMMWYRYKNSMEIKLSIRVYFQSYCSNNIGLIMLKLFFNNNGNKNIEIILKAYVVNIYVIEKNGFQTNLI